MRIILFTNNLSGGIMQFSIQLLKELNLLNIDTYLFLPRNSIFHLEDEYQNRLEFYDFGGNKFKKKISEAIQGNRYVRKVARQIENMKADYLWAMDDLPFTSLTGCFLSKHLNTILTIHDPNRHPDNRKLSILSKWFYWDWEKAKKRFIDLADHIIALSPNSKSEIKSIYRKGDGQIFLMPLGAHIPNVTGNKPVEVDPSYEAASFFLFFGRVEYYKGIETLIRTFTLLDEGYLIIAGKGSLPDTQKIEIEKNGRILFINRYISDEEMIWLFSHSIASVLPYIEASQSGIIPISYYYGKPVITSDVPGLAQFVENNITGFICESDKQYINAYKRILHNNEEYSEECRKYYHEQLDWKNNIIKFLEFLPSNKNKE